MNNVTLARSAMRIFERFPRFEANDRCELSEIFDHPIYKNADDDLRRSIMMRSAESKYTSENEYPWDNYFGVDLRPMLDGKKLLDLGCFTGGRSIAWYERYAAKRITGIDVRDEFIEAAGNFSSSRDANAEFRKSVGEALPFADETFDAVLSFDVFEHVQDIGGTLSECRRVLKKGGRLFLVFPGYFQPLEHHLNLVSATPCLHWLFSGRTLVKAYCEILEERGADADWYKRHKRELAPWERCNTINGTTYSEFLKLVADSDWRVVLNARKPIGSIGRNISRNPAAKLISTALVPMVHVPGFRELFLHRISMILEK